MPLITENKRSLFDYEILARYHAGIVLLGFEAKAVFYKKAALAGSFVIVRGGEAFWINATIAPYQPKNTPKGYEKTRPRKLLLSKREIAELAGKTAQKGLTLIPISLYNEGRKIKLEFGLARSKKKFEKREDIKEREFAREKGRALRGED
ncbi:MAG: SsrA-binding protein SmpB [Candidatus Azambacteria bacterium]|nr:SsrA-binding protein SmpB [Candidatus Azambacteria bacterium]